jgi:arylsulfatase A-like enzyme
MCDEQQYTLQHYLQQAGYRTGLYGKYLNRWLADQGTIDSCRGSPGVPSNIQKGAPPFFNDYSVFGFNADSYTPGQLLAVSAPSADDVNYDPSTGEALSGAYSTTYIKNRALNFIQAREQNDDQPWFLYLSPNAPHAAGQSSGPEAWASMSADPCCDPGMQVPHYRPPRESDRSDKPPWVRNWTDQVQAFEENPPPLGFQEQQARTLAGVDDLVRQVFAQLDAAGETQNTLAFFMSDNGFMLREHGSGRDHDGRRCAYVAQKCGVVGKNKPYLDGIEVPFFMRWPAGPTSPKDLGLAANIDLAPTVMDAVNLYSGARPMDGRSLLDGTSRQELLTEGWRLPTSSVPSWASIVTPTYQYTAYDDYPDTPAVDPFKEYYNLSTDRKEFNNVYGADGIPGTADDGTTSPPPPSAASLASRLAALKACQGQGSCP